MNIFFTVMVVAIFAYLSYELTDGRDRRHKRRIEKKYQEYLDSRNKKPVNESVKAETVEA